MSGDLDKKMFLNMRVGKFYRETLLYSEKITGFR